MSWVLGSSGFLTGGDMSLRTQSSLRSWALGCLGRCPFWVCCPQAGPGRGPSSCGCVSLILTLPPSSTDFFLLFISLGHLALWFLILCVYLFVPSSPYLGKDRIRGPQACISTLSRTWANHLTSGPVFCISKVRILIFNHIGLFGD